MDTPYKSQTVWVVVKEISGQFPEVEELGYKTRELAAKRVAHIRKNDHDYWAWFYPVEVAFDPPEPMVVPVPVPAPLPPSAVMTVEDPAIKLQVAYDAPRRVFSQPGAYAAWVESQIDSGNLVSVPQAGSLIDFPFEVSPEGQLSLFPRDLPAPAHS